MSSARRSRAVPSSASSRRKNHLLPLSPATATAAVYELNDQGISKLADSVPEFVAQQVDAALA